MTPMTALSVALAALDEKLSHLQGRRAQLELSGTEQRKKEMDKLIDHVSDAIEVMEASYLSERRKGHYYHG